MGFLIQQKASPEIAMPVNLQPFFYGRSFKDAAQLKDSKKPSKRCFRHQKSADSKRSGSL